MRQSQTQATMELVMNPLSPAYHRYGAASSSRSNSEDLHRRSRSGGSVRGGARGQAGRGTGLEPRKPEPQMWRRARTVNLNPTVQSPRAALRSLEMRPANTMESMDDDQLPPLLSMAIQGLPPMQQSKYVHEAEKLMKQNRVERYHNIISLDSYCRVGLSLASYMYPGVISVDRLVAISIHYALGFLLDDFIDNPHEFRLADQYGIDRSAHESPQKMQAYLAHLNAVFSQQQTPRSPATLIETMMWESGRDILELSNPEWFNTYVESLIEQHHTSVASHADIVAGHNLCFHDLESYTVMRAGNVGGKAVQLMAEFANNTYVPSVKRSDLFMQKVTTAASIHLGFANDVLSYHKESSQPGANPRNLITVLMECEGKSFVPTVHQAIGLVNEYAQTIVDLESEAWRCGLQSHLQDMKAVIAGNVYFGCMDKRYRQADSVFPEQRDMTMSWKIGEPHPIHADY